MSFLIDLKAPPKSRPAAPPDGARDMSALDERQRQEMTVLDACAMRAWLAWCEIEGLSARHDRLKEKLERYMLDPDHGMGTARYDEADRLAWRLSDEIAEAEHRVEGEIARAMRAWERIGTVGQAMVGLTWGVPPGLGSEEFGAWLEMETYSKSPMPMVEAPF